MGEGWWWGQKGSAWLRQSLGERLGRTDPLQANKWTFYEAPLSENQSEKSSGNRENNLVLIAPRWSLKSRVCKRRCWRTCYLKKKSATDLVLKGKKWGLHTKTCNIQYSRYSSSRKRFCGGRERAEKKKSGWGLYKRMNHCGLPMKAEEAVHKICDL